MKYSLFYAISVAAVVPAFAVADPPRAVHPDLSGVWSYAIDLPPAAIKKQVNGSATIQKLNHGVTVAKAPVKGALPSTPAPSYKAEFQAKVKDLIDHESKTDEVFYCGKPGIPRIGPPRKIVQTAGEVIFFYEDISGDPYRIIPTDGRPHRADADPTYYGDSVAHWAGDTLVVDVTNFVETTWFGEEGYFHSDAMHVTERLWKDGENLIYQVTVDDPKVLTAPWTMAPRVVKPSTEPLEESPRCVEADATRLVNNDHHGQR
jgi:hypothetical protein